MTIEIRQETQPVRITPQVQPQVMPDWVVAPEQPRPDDDRPITINPRRPNRDPLTAPLRTRPKRWGKLF